MTGEVKLSRVWRGVRIPVGCRLFDHRVSDDEPTQLGKMERALPGAVLFRALGVYDACVDLREVFRPSEIGTPDDRLHAALLQCVKEFSKRLREHRRDPVNTARPVAIEVCNFAVNLFSDLNTLTGR